VVVARLEQPQRAVTPTPAAAQPDTRADDGRFLVQAAAMSTYERAQKVAGAIGGSVSQAGRYYRVHTGPFATRAQAEASLAKVRAAGYSDARIYTNG
jgi:rare lipoprotein A